MLYSGPVNYLSSLSHGRLRHTHKKNEQIEVIMCNLKMVLLWLTLLLNLDFFNAIMWTNNRCLCKHHTRWRKEKGALRDALSKYFIMKPTFVESLDECWLQATNMLLFCRHALNSSYCVEAGRHAGLTLRWGRWISQREATCLQGPR